MTAMQAEHVVGERAGWRAVAMPAEHGGWGLTLEPVLAVMQFVWVRRAPIPAKQVGLRQMGMGLALVAVTAVGVLW